MLALVTGAGGFLGRYVAEALIARGDRVRGLARGQYPELARLGVDCRSIDLADRDQVTAACEGVDAVFHVAGLAGIWGPWQTYYRTNTLGTQHIVEGCLRHGVTRLVYTSTPSVTFDGSDQCGVDERAPYAEKWLCHYPHSKALAEQHVLAANGTQHANGQLLTCAIRPHLIWGPRDNHLIPRLVARAKSGRLRQVGSGQNLIDMIHVENAAVAHLQACDRLTAGSPVCGRAYFLSQGEPVNCWGWINELLDVAGVARISRKISAAAAYRLGACCEGVYSLFGWRAEPPMTRFLAAQLSTHHYFDLTRAKEDFGYAPAISAAEGLARLATSGELRKAAAH